MKTTKPSKFRASKGGKRIPCTQGNLSENCDDILADFKADQRACDVLGGWGGWIFAKVPGSCFVFPGPEGLTQGLQAPWGRACSLDVPMMPHCAAETHRGPPPQGLRAGLPQGPPTSLPRTIRADPCTLAVCPPRLGWGQAHSPGSESQAHLCGVPLGKHRP